MGYSPSPNADGRLKDSLVKASRPLEIKFRGQRIFQADDDRRSHQTTSGAIIPRDEYDSGLLASACSPPPLDELKDEGR